MSFPYDPTDEELERYINTMFGSNMYGGNRAGKSTKSQAAHNASTAFNWSEVEAEFSGVGNWAHEHVEVLRRQESSEESKRRAYRESGQHFHTFDKQERFIRPPHSDSCQCDQCETYSLVANAPMGGVFEHTPSCKCIDCWSFNYKKDGAYRWKRLRKRMQMVKDVGIKPATSLINELKSDVKSLQLLVDNFIYIPPYNSMRVLSNQITPTNKDKCEKCSKQLLNEPDIFNWFSAPFSCWLLTCRSCWLDGGAVLSSKGSRFKLHSTKSHYYRVA
jgi:hypothetical protein